MKIVFLLGAGASKPAGVPLVVEFIAEFKKTLSDRLLRTMEKLEKRLATLGRDVDVELVLDALEKAETLKEDTAAALLGRTRLAVGPLDDLLNLRQRLRQYIRQRCFDVTPDRIEYLVPLLGFARTEGTLDVFTLNYDMCVEMIAEKQGVDYTDGFDLFWSPKRFDETGTPSSPLVRVYKIHGSAIWYRRENFRYVKIPLLPGEGDVQYFTHEKVPEMIIYPALSKGGETGPYPELMHRFRTMLATAETVVAIGYRFRDDEIRRLVHEALFGNPRLVLFLVTPSSASIKARFFSGRELVTRIISVPEKIESVLGSGRLHRGISLLDAARSAMERAESFKPMSYDQAKRHYQEVIGYYRTLGQSDAVKALVEDEESRNPVKARDFATHLLHDASLCLRFALEGGKYSGLWWRLLAALLYWWEVGLSPMVYQYNDLTLSARKGFPELSNERRFLEAEELKDANRQLSEYIIAHALDPSNLITTLARQMGRLTEIQGFYIPVPRTTPDSAQQVRALISQCTQEDGVSVIASRLAG
jgi:hypothetical protein